MQHNDMNASFFENNLQHFYDAYHSNQSDDECIRLISDNPEVRKFQLQIALGNGVLGHPENNQKHGRMVGLHLNKRLALQQSLIASIDDKTFLSSALRDFIIRPCDAGQVLCPNADLTVAMLLEAGADPTTDRVDQAYVSPGKNFVSINYNGKCLQDILVAWLQPENQSNPILLKILKHLATRPPTTHDKSPENLVRRLMEVCQTNPASPLWVQRNIVTTIHEIVNALLAKGITAHSLPELMHSVKLTYANDFTAAIASYDDERDLLSQKFRHAEALVLEGLYAKQIDKEQKIIRHIKISLLFAPLILPLIATAILGVILAVTRSRHAQTLKVKDMTVNDLARKMHRTLIPNPEAVETTPELLKQLQEKYQGKLPAISKHPSAVYREAVVFNKNLAKKGDDFIYTWSQGFQTLFHGYSEIPSDNKAKLVNEVRIYRVRA